MPSFSILDCSPAEQPENANQTDLSHAARRLEPALHNYVSSLIAESAWQDSTKDKTMCLVGVALQRIPFSGHDLSLGTSR